MKDELTKILDDMKFEGEAGDVVTVLMNGNFKVLSVDLRDTDYDEDDVYMLEEYIAVAMNEVVEKVKYAREKVIEGMK